jgi:pimeloyl-ACP methyl ester carboxylesterase
VTARSGARTPAPRKRPAPPGPRSGSVLSISQRRFHRIAYVEWGDPASRKVVLCVHGLTRQGRDFDPLAMRLAEKGYRVVCPDLVGRGRSGRLSDPEEYALPQYCVDMTALIARIGAEQIDWIGTSLGGLIGMIVAAMGGDLVRRLVINDIGPALPWAALRRIGDYLERAPRKFANLQAAEQYFREIHSVFGPLTAAQWRHVTEHSVVADASGQYRLRYDPGIGNAFRPGRVYNVQLWNYWDVIHCPTLVLRGEHSDLLTSDIARQMSERGPRAEVVEIGGCGHAPALMDRGQIGIVTGWLERQQATIRPRLPERLMEAVPPAPAPQTSPEDALRRWSAR